MIIGIGNDIIEIGRINHLIQKFDKKFIDKIFTANEFDIGQKFLDDYKKASFFAKRFSAKESFAKACGIGLGSVIKFTDIEVVNNKDGKPLIRILNDKKKTLLDIFLCKNFIIHVSLSDEKNYAISTVIIEKIK